MIVEFVKYEGAGNDFVVIDNRRGGFSADVEVVAAICDRRFGVGGDGLMLLENDSEVEFRMRYFNADGREATMCGNGGRCIALFAHHLGIGGNHKTFVAADGLHSADILEFEGDGATVSLKMNDVQGIAKIGNGFSLNTGSPHYVELVDDVDSVDVAVEGRRIRWSEEFAAQGGTNVNFVQLAGGNSIKIRTFERGVEAETLACGTGAVASAIVAATGLGGNNFDIRTCGGRLNVSFTDKGGGVHGDVCLTGPARRVFTGELTIDN
jgi:diaminopimelate epimerase